MRKKSLGNPKHKAWKLFSEYIRQRDADENGIATCISCGARQHWKELDAGHFIPGSVSSALRFHEINVNPQCSTCNRWKHGNAADYALRLQRQHGMDVIEKLDEIRRENEGFRITKSDYLEIIEKYQAKLAELDKSLGR